MWVGILENKNVGYKSICMRGKVNNGLLNDIKNDRFQVYSPVFSDRGHSTVKNTGGGGWLDSLGSEILVGKNILGFFKILI